MHRGDTLYREIELTDRTVRIGRNPDNDLILEDGGKSVSRHHAEIRYENGRYVLADRESQNGVWVSGSRLPSVVLAPNVVASVGPYRLMLDSTGSSAVADTGGTEYSVSRETIVAPAIDRLPKAAPPPPPPPKPVADSKRPDPKRKAAPPRSGGQSKWLLGALAAVVVAAAGVGIWLFVMRQPAPQVVVVENDLEAPKRLIESEDCEGALRWLEPVLTRNPDQPRALELKARAEACVQVQNTPKVDPPLDAAGHLSAALLMLESGDCAGALAEHINLVLETDPLNVDATELKKKADAACTVAGPTTTVPPLIEIDGVRRVKGESEKNYQARVQAMRDRYAEASSALSAAEYQRAATMFEAIAREAGGKYLDASEKAAEARKVQSGVAQKNLQAARDFESKGDWDRALEAYRRARQADPNINVDAEITRITGQKSGVGKKNCEEANARYSYGRTAEALQLYQEALKYLPPDDPCIQTARERFPNLRK